MEARPEHAIVRAEPFDQLDLGSADDAYAWHGRSNRCREREQPEVGLDWARACERGHCWPRADVRIRCEAHGDDQRGEHASDSRTRHHSDEEGSEPHFYYV